MAAKVFLLSIDKREREKVKRSAAEYLVRQLMAVQLSRYIYQRIQVKPADHKPAYNPPAEPYIPELLPPATDQAMGLKLVFPVLKGQVRFRSFGRSEQYQI